MWRFPPFYGVTDSAGGDGSVMMVQWVVPLCEKPSFNPRGGQFLPAVVSNPTKSTEISIPPRSANECQLILGLTSVLSYVCYAHRMNYKGRSSLFRVVDLCDIVSAATQWFPHSLCCHGEICTRPTSNPCVMSLHADRLQRDVTRSRKDIENSLLLWFGLS